MSNRRKFKIKLPGVILFQAVALVLLSSCFKTYYLSNGEKYRNFLPVKDVHIVTEKELNQHKFDYGSFENPDTVKSVVQFITPADIVQISDSIKRDLLVIFYYPNCKNINLELAMAEFAEKNNIPYILVSAVYSPERTRAWFANSGLKNQNHYVIPSLNRKNRLILCKKKDFIKSCSPECYDLVKDELIHTTLFRFSKEKHGSTEPNGGYGKEEFYTDWIKQEFDLKTP
jgi:hypothetical protein